MKNESIYSFLTGNFEFAGYRKQKMHGLMTKSRPKRTNQKLGFASSLHMIKKKLYGYYNCLLRWTPRHMLFGVWAISQMTTFCTEIVYFQDQK